MRCGRTEDRSLYWTGRPERRDVERITKRPYIHIHAVTFKALLRLSIHETPGTAVSTDKQTAFMQAYAKCHEPFVRYCSALAYGKMDAQDLVQDVLLSAFQKFETIEKKDELLHYLVRAARYRAISVWRVQRRNADVCEKQLARLKERGATAEMLVDVRIVYDALHKLPAAQREALVLFEVSGLTMAEIAEIQSCSEGAVKTSVSRGRAKVRTLLDGRSRAKDTEVLHAIKTLML